MLCFPGIECFNTLQHHLIDTWLTLVSFYPDVSSLDATAINTVAKSHVFVFDSLIHSSKFLCGKFLIIQCLFYRFLVLTTVLNESLPIFIFLLLHRSNPILLQACHAACRGLSSAIEGVITRCSSHLILTHFYDLCVAIFNWLCAFTAQ